MNKCIALFATVLFSTTMLFAQNLDIDFSESIKYEKDKRAFTREIAAENEDRVYVLLDAGNAIAKAFVPSKTKLRLQSFDKKTLKPLSYIDLNLDLPSEKATLIDVMQSANGIVVLSSIFENGMKTIYATRYDWDLKPVLRKQKVFVYDSYKSFFDVMIRPNSDDIAFLAQKKVEAGEPISVEYSVYDVMFSFVNSGQINFPIVKKEKEKGLFKALKYSGNESLLGSIEYTSKGELVAFVYIAPEDDSRPGSYSLQFVDATTNDVVTQDVRLKSDDFFESISLLLYGDELVLTGFYSNAVTRKKLLSNEIKKSASSRIAGTFFKRFKISDRSLISETQAPFDEDFVFNINSQNPANRSWFSSKVNNAQEDDFSDNYQIRKVFFNPDQMTARIYCEYKRNTVTTTTSTNANGGTTSSTTYTSTRGNLFYYEISLKDGKFLFGNIIRKYATYSSSSSEVWNKVSMQVLPGNKEDVILYLTQRLFNENNKEDVRGEKIKVKKFEQDFVTATVNNKKGTYKLVPPKLASGKVSRERKVQLDKAYWSSEDEALYTINSKFTPNWGFTALSCALTPVCGIGYCMYAFLPNKRMVETFTISKVSQK